MALPIRLRLVEYGPAAGDDVVDGESIGGRRRFQQGLGSELAKEKPESFNRTGNRKDAMAARRKSRRLERRRSGGGGWEEEEAAAESGRWELAPPVSQEEGSHFPCHYRAGGILIPS